MATRSLTPTVRPFTGHPITRSRETADWDTYRRAADTACVIEAALARVRRLAGIEPAPAFARTVELAVHEVRVVCAHYWSRDVERWQASVMKELGGLLFAHVGEAQIEVYVGRAPHLARRDGEG